MQKAKQLAIQKINEKQQMEIEGVVPEKNEKEQEETDKEEDKGVKFEFAADEVLFNTELINTHFKELPRPFTDLEIYEKAKKSAEEGMQINIRNYESKQSVVIRDYVDHYISMN